MDENTKKALKERFDALPKTVQDSILSSEYQNTLIEISNKHQMTVAQLGVLEQETTLVMMGLTNTNDFKKELMAQLGIEEAKCDQVIADINEKVFQKIRDLLKLMNTPKGEEPDLGTMDEETLKTSGIEIEKTRPNSEENLIQTTLPTSTLQSRADILNGIEHPTDSKPSFVGKQLAGSFSMPTKETTYIPKPSSPIPAPAGKGSTPSTSPSPSPSPSEAPKSDPYREAF